MSSTLLRLLGVQALARVGSRMSGPGAQVATLVSLVVANLLPILAVLQDAASVGDVFALYWIENVVVGAVTVVKVLSAEGDATQGPKLSSTTVDVSSQRALAGFFCLHYGIFTFVHGVFTVVIIVIAGGFDAGVVYWIVTVAAMIGSYLISLGVEWFGRGQQLVVSPGAAMFAPYPRMLVLHLAVIAAFFFVVEPEGDDAVWAVVVLCGLKTAVDVALTLFGPWRRSVRIDRS